MVVVEFILEYGKIVLFCVNVAVFVFLIWSTRKSVSSTSSSSSSSVNDVLLLTAHPDDEVMFFAPLLRSLRGQNRSVTVLCLSRGNTEREKEFLRSCADLGVQGNLDSFEDGFQHCWDPEKVANAIEKCASKMRLRTLVTFDQFGVSGHPNHIACWRGAVQWAQGKKEVSVLFLHSVSLWRKYLGLFEAIATIVMGGASPFFLSWDPFLVWKLMKNYPTQNVWYRKLLDYMMEGLLDKFSGLSVSDGQLLPVVLVHEHGMQAHAPASEKYVFELPQRTVAIESFLRGLGFAEVSALKPRVQCAPKHMASAPWSLSSSPLKTSALTPDELLASARHQAATAPLTELLEQKQEEEQEQQQEWELYKNTPKKKDSLWEKCRVVKAVHAEPSWLLLVHTEQFLREFACKSLLAKLGGVTFTEQNGDLYFCPGTLSSALLAAGGAVLAVKELFHPDGSKKADLHSSFALVRPPGHHCGAEQQGGFCMLSNSAIAAQYARKVLGLPRVAIVDLDYHHGDGTQHIFYDDPSVLCISIHVGVTYGSNGLEAPAPASTYPYGPDKGFSRLGGSAGATGFNVNVVWPHEFVDECDYEEAMQTVVVPLLRRFDPQLIVWACGFDAVKGDKLAGTLLSPDSFWRLARHLKSASAAAPPVCAVLEGGYRPELLALCAENVVRGLAGLSGPTLRRKAADPASPATVLPENGEELKTWRPPVATARPIPPALAALVKDDGSDQLLSPIGARIRPRLDSHPIRPEAVLEHVRRTLNKLDPWKNLFVEVPAMTHVEEEYKQLEAMF